VPTGWSNDLHLPDPRYQKGFEGDAFIARADFGQFPAIVQRRPHWIELAWDRPVKLGAARIISGYNSGGHIVGPLEALLSRAFGLCLAKCRILGHVGARHVAE
jgi:hypothetical protein